MTYVLILFMTFNGGVMTSVDDFKTLAACNTAGTKFVTDMKIKKNSPEFLCLEVTK